jgi:Kef-type K+ transport system membrane component KefB
MSDFVKAEGHPNITVKEPPALPNEGKPLLIPEGEPTPNPSSEIPSSTIAEEKPTPTPQHPQKPGPTEEEVHPPEAKEKEVSTTQINEEYETEKAGTGKPPAVVKEGYSEAAVKESPSSTVDEVSTAITTPDEPTTPRGEHLLPTNEFEQVPVLGEKEPPSIFPEEEQPSTKEPQQAVETEKLSEGSLPVEEHPPVVEKETPLAIEEKTLPEGIPPVEPPAPPITEGQDKMGAEKETLPAIEVEETPPASYPIETLPPRGKEGVLEEVEVAEPLLTEPETLEEPTKPYEPPKEIVEEIEPSWDIWHTGPFEYALLGVAIILIAGKVGGEVARVLRTPEVVGKVIIGMLLGNVYFLTGWDFFHFLRVIPLIENLAYFGSLTLLLSAGLHTDLRAVLRVGVSSILVCLGGIVAPAGLGFLVSHFLLPDTPIGPKLLLAIILCSSSIGLVLATLYEIKAIDTPEGKVLTGAIILTDIIVILAFGVVSGVVARGSVHILGVVATIGIVLTFLSTIFVTNLLYAEGLGNFLTKKVPEGLKISIVAVSSLLLAFLSGSIGLITIIGPFAAGMFFRNMKLIDSDGREYGVEWIIRPAYMILVPIFFVWVGAIVDWKSFLYLDTVFLGLAITGVAFLGKLFCSICIIDPGINRMAIGIGMATKLEGVLILSGIGRKMHILDDVLFSSFIMVVVFTSIICPLLLKVILSRKRAEYTLPPRSKFPP